LEELGGDFAAGIDTSLRNGTPGEVIGTHGQPQVGV
jgi:hypothetical protein